jgi:MFS family permease
MSEKTQPKRRMPATVWLLGLTSLLTDASSDMIVPLLPAFLTQVIGAGPAFVGLVEGVADAVAAVLRLISGAISDRMSRRKPLVVLGYGVAGLVRPLVALATTPFHVLAVRVVDRFGKGVRSAPRDALIADVAPEGAAARAFGIHRAMDHAGAMLGPLIAAGLLATGAPLRRVFALAAIPAAFALVAVLFVREPAHAPATSAPTSALPAWRLGWPAGPLGGFLVVVLIFAIGNATDGFLLLRAQELSVPLALIPILWAMHHACKVLSTLVGGTLADRVGRVPVIASGWLSFAAAYVGMALASEAWHAWALMLLYGLYHGLSEPAEKALVRDLASAQDRGRAFGAYTFVTGIASLPAGIITGVIWQRFGSAAALACSAALAVVACALLVAWNGRRAKTQVEI